MRATRSRYVAVVCAVAVAACGGHRDAPDLGPLGPVDVPRTCTVDDAPPVCDPAGTGSTQTFVVAHLVFPEATVDNVEPGFDLDHSDVQVCGADDWIGDPPLADGCGIDNQLAPFQTALVGTMPQEAIAAGRLLLLVVVGGIDDPANDPCVDVRVGLASMRASVTAPMLAPDGGLAPSQVFDLDATSLDSDHVTWLYRFDGGRISGGRLEAAGGTTTLPVAALTFPLFLPVHDARLVATFSADGLTAGVIGGAIRGSELLDAVAHDPTECSYVGTIGPILASQSDLEPTRVELPDGGRPVRCGAISIALTFDAVPASLSSCTTDATCAAGRTCLAGHCAVSYPDGGRACP